MNARLLVVAAVVMWAGVTIVLADLRRLNRRPLHERLGPYAPGSPMPARAGIFSADNVRALVEPLARQMGARVARLFGVGEELAVRLERCHSPIDVTAFRLRQLGWSVGAVGLGVVAALALHLPPPVATLFVLGSPLLAFLAVEQRLAVRSERWQRRLLLELPVVAEQLGMLIGAGYSLGAALERLARRGRGACRADLARVCGRMRQGLSEVDALREWSMVAGVDAVERLVAVLALNREATDLGRLIADESRAIRRDVQRGVTELIERRAQQVWVPVTVATLVPGVLFLAVPFLEAMRLFAGS